jgi:hypothetical protein
VLFYRCFLVAPGIPGRSATACITSIGQRQANLESNFFALQQVT